MFLVALVALMASLIVSYVSVPQYKATSRLILTPVLAY